MTELSNIKRFSAIFLFLFLIPAIFGCPTNPNIVSICKCENSFNGISLDCSNNDDTPTVIRMLKDNQAQLGLVQQLTLQNGTLTQLTDGMFEGLFVKKLDLTNNRIINVTNGAFGGLENIMQILILRNNLLQRPPTRPLTSMTSLIQLDLSNNEIIDIVDDRVLFEGMPKLTDLNLSGNRICNLHKDVFENIKNTLQTLNLGENCFSKVPAASLRGFKQLLALHLHRNRIDRLEPLQFMNLPFLNLINLADNRITDVHRQSFLNVPNLRFMYLSENNLTSLEPDQFRTFENLELLDLTKNRLRRLPTSTFGNMPKLSQLYLGDNDISEIEPNAFGNSSLIILLLSGNSLSSLNQDMFNGLSYLQQFSLKRNKIVGFSSNTFYQLPSLVVLDLSDNQLVVLQPATFLAQLNLFLLDLSGNKLVAVPYNAFNQRIVTVLLQENPLVCTERVHILQNGVGVFVPDSPDKICGGSPKLLASTPEINDAPAFIQISTHFTETPDSGKATKNTVPLPNNSVPNKNNASGVFRPLATGVPNLLYTVKPIIQPISDPLPVSPVSSVNFANQPDQPQFEIIHSPTTNPIPISRQQQTPQISAARPVFQNFDNFVTNSPFINSNQQPPIQHTQFPNFPPNRNNEFNLPNNPAAENTNFFWTTPTTREPPAQPYTIPFLTQGPIVGPAFAIGPAFTLPSDFITPNSPATVKTADDTLPPSIIIASLPPWTTPKIKEALDTVRPYPEFPTEVVKYIEVNNYNNPTVADNANFNFTKEITQLPPQVKTVPPKKTADDFPGGPDAAVGGDFNNNQEQNGISTAKTSATTTIAVCLTVVVVVMVAVFVTLCVVRRKNENSKKSVSSASRTSAYVAAQAARMNYAAAAAHAASSTYGTGTYVREAPPRPPRSGKSSVASGKFGGGISNGALQQPQNTQTWIYAPSTYASASQYYK